MNVCDEIRDKLPGSLDGSIDAAAAEHAGSCLRCQAEIAQYRRLGRALRSLEYQLAAAPTGLYQSVMRALESAEARAARLWRGALIGAGGLIVAAGGTTAGILLSRRRLRVAS